MRSAKLLPTVLSARRGLVVALLAPALVVGVPSSEAAARASSGRTAAARDGVAERLSALADPESAVRAAAERWLAAHVEPADAGLLAGALASGDAEVGRRLAHVLARAPRGLDLAALLRERAGDASAPITEVAEDAVRERWAASGALEYPALRGAEPVALALELWASFGASSTVRLELTGTLADAAALLEREGRTFLGLAVEPAARARRPRQDAPRVLAGPWNRVCLALADAYGVEPELHGVPLEAAEAAPTSPTFLVFAEGGRAARSDERVLAWFREVVLEPDAAKRADAALALVSSGWPDALEWLERRFLEDGDGAALEALLHAATTGRVVQALLDPARVRGLIGLAEREAAQPGARAGSGRVELVLRALSALPPLGIDGASLADAIHDGWEDAGARGRWVRLVALAGMRAPRGREAALEVLGDPASPSGLVLQALHTLAACGGAGPTPPELTPGFAARLLALTADPAQAAELGRTLAQANLGLPDAPPAPGLLPSIAYLVWALEAGDAARAGRAWATIAPSGAGAPGGAGASTGAGASDIVAALSRALRDAAPALAPSDLVAAWKAAREGATRVAGAGAPGAVAAIDESAIRSGGLAAEQVAEILAGASGQVLLAASAPDLLAVVAGLGAHPAAIRARAELLGSLRAALEGGQRADVAAALLPLERALDECLANGFDVLADELVRGVELARVEHRRQKEAVAPLAAWPPSPRLSEVDLTGRARRFDVPDLGPTDG